MWGIIFFSHALNITFENKGDRLTLLKLLKLCSFEHYINYWVSIEVAWHRHIFSGKFQKLNNASVAFDTPHPLEISIPDADDYAD